MEGWRCAAIIVVRPVCHTAASCHDGSVPHAPRPDADQRSLVVVRCTVYPLCNDMRVVPVNRAVHGMREAPSSVKLLYAIVLYVSDRDPGEDDVGQTGICKSCETTLMTRDAACVVAASPPATSLRELWRSYWRRSCSPCPRCCLDSLAGRDEGGQHGMELRGSPACTT